MTHVLKSTEVVVAEAGASSVSPAVREAVADAYDRGVEAGRVAAEAEMAEVLVILTAALERTTQAAVAAVVDTVALDGATMTTLAADLATWFMEGAAMADPSIFLAAADAAHAGVLDGLTLILSVHPDLVDPVSAVVPGNVEVRGDAGLGRGDHRLVADETIVERTWSQAIQDVGPSIAAALDVAR